MAEKNDPNVVPPNLPEVRGSTFLINHEFKDFWSNVQHAMRRLGDVGPESEAYKAAAFHQFARQPDEFIAPETYGTIGRMDNKNYNRMEYDKVGRPDKKDHASVMKEVEGKKILDIGNMLKAIKPKDGYTVNTSDTMVSDKALDFGNHEVGLKLDKEANINFPEKK